MGRQFEVIFFEHNDGTTPALTFIQSLDAKMRSKVYRLLRMIEENGTDLREPYSKHLDDGIFELRAQFGSDITRILYFFFVGRRVIVTNGFIKKTRKTPPSEIDRAKAYRREFLDRGGHDHEDAE